MQLPAVRSNYFPVKTTSPSSLLAPIIESRLLPLKKKYEQLLEEQKQLSEFEQWKEKQRYGQEQEQLLRTGQSSALGSLGLPKAAQDYVGSGGSLSDIDRIINPRVDKPATIPDWQRPKPEQDAIIDFERRKYPERFDGRAPKDITPKISNWEMDNLIFPSDEMLQSTYDEVDIVAQEIDNLPENVSIELKKYYVNRLNELKDQIYKRKYELGLKHGLFEGQVFPDNPRRSLPSPTPSPSDNLGMQGDSLDFTPEQTDRLRKMFLR